MNASHGAPLPDVDTLASEFTIVVREWLTEEELREIDRRNRSEMVNGHASICHSHDFCDANQAMLDALGRFTVDLNLQDENQVALINAAWDRAKMLGFSSATNG